MSFESKALEFIGNPSYEGIAHTLGSTTLGSLNREALTNPLLLTALEGTNFDVWPVIGSVAVVVIGALVAKTQGDKFAISIADNELGLLMHGGRTRNPKTAFGDHDFGGYYSEVLRPGLHFYKAPIYYMGAKVNVAPRFIGIGGFKIDGDSPQDQHDLGAKLIVSVAPEKNKDGSKIDYGVSYETILRRAMFGFECRNPLQHEARENALEQMIGTVMTGAFRDIGIDHDDLSKAKSGDVLELLKKEKSQELFDNYGMVMRGLVLQDIALTTAAVNAYATMEAARIRANATLKVVGLISEFIDTAMEVLRQNQTENFSKAEVISLFTHIVKNMPREQSDEVGA